MSGELRQYHTWVPEQVTSFDGTNHTSFYVDTIDSSQKVGLLQCIEDILAVPLDLHGKVRYDSSDRKR
jgi:hypothetical protein